MSNIHIYLGAEQKPQLAGIAYATARHGRVATSFAYDQNYLGSREAYAFDPQLELQAGNWPLLTHELPGSFADASPDRWGQ
jgi:serine/threonine-protein kinase HipA